MITCVLQKKRHAVRNGIWGFESLAGKVKKRVFGEQGMLKKVFALL